MNKLLVIMFITFGVMLNAFQFRIIEEPVEVPNHVGFVNLPHDDRYDINNELCGMLIVRTGIEDMNIDSPFRSRLIPKEGEYWVILSAGTRYVDLKKVDYVTHMVDFSESIRRIEAGKVYEMYVDGDGGMEFIPVSIITQPGDTEKWLDGKLLGTKEGFSVKKGEHRLEIKCEGFKDYVTNIEVNEDNFLFKDIKLEKLKPVKVTIKSEPQGAELYLDNVKKGDTDIQIFLYPSEYNIRLVMNNYETIYEKLVVKEEGDNLWNFNLEKVTSILSVSVIPVDADIYVNFEKLLSKSLEVSAGKYFIEVSKNGWLSDSRTITVKKGEDVTESFKLIQKKGSLQVTVNPIEAENVLKFNNNKINSWTGSKLLDHLPVGDYEITTKLNGYKSIVTEVNIIENEIKSVNVKLIKDENNSKVVMEDVKPINAKLYKDENDSKEVIEDIQAVPEWKELGAVSKKNLRSANQYFRQRIYDKASYYFNKVLEENPYHIESLYSIANIKYEHEKNYAEAYLYYKKTLTAIGGLFLEYEKMKNTDTKNAKKFQKTYILKPDIDDKKKKSESLLENSMLLITKKSFEDYNEKKYQKVINDLNKISDITKENLQLNKLLANSYYKLNDYSKSIEYYEEVFRLEPDDEKNALIIANTYYINLKDNVNAVIWYKKAIEINPGNSDIYFNLGIVYSNMEEYQKALEMFKRTLNANPENEDALYNAKVMAQNLGKADEYVKFYKMEFERDGYDVEKVKVFCYQLNNMKAYSYVLEYGKIWSDLEPENKAPYQLMYVAANSLGMTELASKYKKKLN